MHGALVKFGSPQCDRATTYVMRKAHLFITIIYCKYFQFAIRDFFFSFFFKSERKWK